MKLALIPVASIAIWNRRKVVVRIAIGLWITNVAFLVQGKSLPLPTNHVPQRNVIYNRCHKGED
jgi:hypothetical protein